MKTSHTIVLSLASLTLAASVPALAAAAIAAPVVATAAASCINYCTPGTTSNGCVAMMSCSGVPSVTALSGFRLEAHVDAFRNGMIRYSLMAHPSQPPWGGLGSNSFLCIKSPMQQMGIQNSNGTAPGQCDGLLWRDFLDWASTRPSALGQPFQPGQDIFVQAIFQDPPAIKSTSLTDGLRFTLEP